MYLGAVWALSYLETYLNASNVSNSKNKWIIDFVENVVLSNSPVYKGHKDEKKIERTMHDMNL